MLYLTGSGLTCETVPILSGHPMIGALATPDSMGPESVRPFKSWGADNGCFTQPERFTMARYLAWLNRMPAGTCHFATAPDVVGDAQATWERSAPALQEIRAAGYKAALVAQNGIENMDIEWEAFDAIFIGGDTKWKLSSHARELCRQAKTRGLWVHMGRVNSLRRLEIAESFGCDSVDGNYLGFGPNQNTPKLLRWLRQIEIAPMLNFVPKRTTGL